MGCIWPSEPHLNPACLTCVDSIIFDSALIDPPSEQQNSEGRQPLVIAVVVPVRTIQCRSMQAKLRHQENVWKLLGASPHAGQGFGKKSCEMKNQHSRRAQESAKLHRARLPSCQCSTLSLSVIILKWDGMVRNKRACSLLLYVQMRCNAISDCVCTSATYCAAT